MIGGSYNYSMAAEKRNAENVTVTQSQEIAKLYENNFRDRLAVSEVYTSKRLRLIGNAKAIKRE